MKNYDVFISHSHIDKQVADAICHYFENDGIKCWMAPRDIVPGANWAHSIADAIPQCKIFLLVFSANSNMSDQVLREVELAASEKLIIMPVKIEDLNPTGGMKYYLSTVHWIDAVNKKTEKYIKNTAETVKELLKIKREPPEGESEGDTKRGTEKDEPKENQIKPWALVLVAAAVVILAVLAIVFRENIFGREPASLDAANQPTSSLEITEATDEPTAKPTIEPTAEPTAVPTAEPTATIDPNISPDTIIDIPDIGLKTAVLRTLNEMGQQVAGSITVGDLQKLKTLYIISGDSYDPESIDRTYLVYPITLNTTIKSLEGLQYASNLVQLQIENFELEDISALSPLYKLERLSISGNKVEDISALANLGNLTLLNCSYNSISDISSLILLYNINTLYISNNPISDISPLRDMSEMTKLRLDSMNLTNLNALSGMTKLEILTVCSNPLNNIDALESLTAINSLYLEDCGLKDISALAVMDKLIDLNLLYNDITDASVLENIYKLKTLIIDEDTQNLNEETINKLLQRGCEVYNYIPYEYGQ